MTKAELQALLERIEAATGPDREIDDAIYDMERIWHADAYVRERVIGKYVFLTSDHEYTPIYTFSLDAIVGLISRELPNRGWCVYAAGTPIHAEKYWAKILGVRQSKMRRRPTSALALCAAFIRAKLAMLEASA